MKIALVHDFLVKMGGAERVLKTLADMYPEAPIYTLLYDEKMCGTAFPASRVRTTWLQKFPEFIRKRQKFLFPLMPRAIESFDFQDFDIIISSSNAFAHGVMVPLKTQHLCYSHSPMRYAWDYAHEYLREQKIGIITRIIVERIMKEIRIWDFLAADHVDRYLANSIHVKRRIKKFYRKDADVLYPPVDTRRFRVTTQHQDYFLIVAALTPFKKIDLAIQLFNKIGKKLVVIGSGNQLEYLRSIAGPTVEVLGHRDDKVIVNYLQNCRAFIMCNEEDFGIAPVEAMACGKPVLAYGKGGVLETVIPGETGEFFYEQTIESMEDALGRLIVNELNYVPEKIRKQALKFSKKRFVEGIKLAVQTLQRSTR